MYRSISVTTPSDAIPASCNAVSAASYMRNPRAAMDRSSAHAATMKPTAATAGVCIVRNKADRDENQSGQSEEKESKHDIPP
ncbi:hypothetical protein [Bradyrhizobium sp. USDA 4354]